MTTTAEQAAFDFGVDTNVFRDDSELALPEHQIEQLRRQREVPEPKATRGTAIAAQKAEVAGDPGVPFEYDGETYTVPPSDTWDIEVFEMLEEGKHVLATKLMIGPAQWRKFRSKKRTAADFNIFFALSQEAVSTKSQ